MRFDSLVIAGLGAVCWTSDAFAPGPLRRNPSVSSFPAVEIALTDTRGAVSSWKKYTGKKSSRLFMVDDEDEDEDDDDDDVGDSDDPLGNGVDSVSWLPTVIGAKDKDISAPTREVSPGLYRTDNFPLVAGKAPRLPWHLTLSPPSCHQKTATGC